MLKPAAAIILMALAVTACSSAMSPSATTTPSESAAVASPSTGLGAFPPIPADELPEDLAARLQVILEKAVDDLDAPGIGAAVISADLGTWAGAAGTADGDETLDPAAQFAIASVTKTVTAAQVLQLVESGAVELDRPIAEFLGDDAIETNGATVRQVLGMRSGIGEATGDLREACADLAASVSLADLREVPLAKPYFKPGTSFRYTNSNYAVAGLLIEEITGTTVGRAMRSGVLADPLLERLIYQDEERPTPPLAAPFVKLADVPPPVELLDIGGGYLPARCLASSAGPAGGMAADPMTLARWGYLLYGGSVLGDNALADMTDFENGYGLGAHDYGSSFGVPAVGHEGTVPGYTAQLIAFPEEGLTLAVLMNTNGEERDLLGIAGSLRAALAP